MSFPVNWRLSLAFNSPSYSYGVLTFNIKWFSLEYLKIYISCVFQNCFVVYCILPYSLKLQAVQYPAAKFYLLSIRKGWDIPSRHPESLCLCSHSLSSWSFFPEPEHSLGTLLSVTSIQASSYQLIWISPQDMKPPSCFISLQYRLLLFSELKFSFFLLFFFIYLNKMFICSSLKISAIWNHS